MPIWSGRISPVFDAAGRILLVDADGEAETSRREEPLEETDLVAKAARVASLRVEVLICGAISRPMEDMLTASGVRVVPQTCGDVETVLSAYLTGGLTDHAFLMPGCCGRRRRFRARRRRDGLRRSQTGDSA